MYLRPCAPFSWRTGVVQEGMHSSILDQLRELHIQAERLWGKQVTVRLNCTVSRDLPHSLTVASLRLEVTDDPEGLLWEHSRADTEAGIDPVQEALALLRSCADSGIVPSG